MEEIEQHALRIQKELDENGPQNAAVLRPQVDRLLKTLKQRGMPIPSGLRRIDATLRLEAEEDFFDNMPV